MTLLTGAHRSVTVNIQQVARHFYRPLGDIAIAHQIVERHAQLGPKMLERLRPAAAEYAQRRHLDRIRLGMRSDVELQPSRQILALSAMRFFQSTSVCIISP